MEVYALVNSDDKTDSVPRNNSMGRISMGGMFPDDSIIRGLGVSLWILLHAEDMCFFYLNISCNILM